VPTVRQLATASAGAPRCCPACGVFKPCHQCLALPTVSHRCQHGDPSIPTFEHSLAASTRSSFILPPFHDVRPASALADREDRLDHGVGPFLLNDRASARDRVEAEVRDGLPQHVKLAVSRGVGRCLGSEQQRHRCAHEAESRAGRVDAPIPSKSMTSTPRASSDRRSQGGQALGA